MQVTFNHWRTKRNDSGYEIILSTIRKKENNINSNFVVLVLELKFTTSRIQANQCVH